LFFKNTEKKRIKIILEGKATSRHERKTLKTGSGESDTITRDMTAAPAI
jgi:hypothetical protein